MDETPSGSPGYVIGHQKKGLRGKKLSCGGEKSESCQHGRGRADSIELKQTRC